jgi:sulfide:quinone oxidoreductase
MTRVVILGAGFGGVATAHALRSAAGDAVEVLLIDRRSDFAVGFRKTWGLLDPDRYREGLRPLESLNGDGVTFHKGTIEAVIPSEKAAVVDGERIGADALVLALGAGHDTGAVSGFAEGVHNLYASDQIERIHRALEGFTGGRLGIGVFGAPYTCPPAPYEIAYLLNEFFDERGVEAQLEVFTPKPMSLPILGEAGCSVIEDRLAERGIRFLANHEALQVEANGVEFSNGRRAGYDLLLGIPPHRAPRLLEEAGLVEDGWVRPDPRALETRYPDVYAIGDLTAIPMANGKPLPKAGVFAEGMGAAAAEQILARWMGQEPGTTFDGRGGCFLELGGGEAVQVEGDFLAKPAPEVSISDPSPAHLQAKLAFERERLERWFGG